MAVIWYGRMTMSIFSAVNTQYRVSSRSRLCCKKKVRVKSTRSGMMRFLASAQKEVNSKLLLVLAFLPRGFFTSRMALKRVVLE